MDCVWGPKDMGGVSVVHGKNDWAGWSCASSAMGFLRAGLLRGVDSDEGMYFLLCGSDRIFPPMAEILIGEGIAARTMQMHG
jgi:hypothetical protein